MTVKVRYYLLHLLVRVLGENKAHLSRVTGNSLMSRAFHTSVGRAERDQPGAVKVQASSVPGGNHLPP